MGKTEISQCHLVDGKYCLKDLIDVERLRSVLETFSSVTGFAIGLVTYPEQDILIAAGWRDICSKFHRACVGSEQHCIESNVELTECLKKSKTVNIKHCTNGLVDGATAIIIRDVHVASLFAGQVLFGPPDIDSFKRQAREFGYPEADYLAALAEVPVVTKEKYTHTLSFVNDMATLIIEMGLESLEKRENALRLTRASFDRQHAQEALQDTEKRYLDLYQCLRDGFAQVDLEGRIISCNAAFESMLGYPIEELREKLYQDITPSSWYETEQKIIQTQLSVRGYSDLYEKEYKRKDGSIFPVEMRIYAIKDKSAQLQGYWAIIRDISERKQAIDLLRLQYELALVLSTCGTLSEAAQEITTKLLRIEGVDCGGMYLRNQRISELQLVTHEGLSKGFIDLVSHYDAGSRQAVLVSEGKPVYRNFSELMHTLSPDAIMNEGIKSIAVVPVLYQGQVEACVNAGSRTLDEWSAMSRNALEAIAMQIGGVIARLRMQEELKNSRAELESLFKASPIGMGVVTNRTFTQVNSRMCDMLGYSNEELIGRNVRFLYLSDEEYERVGRDKYAQIKQHNIGIVETNWLRKDGTVIDILLSSACIGGGGDICGPLAFTAWDITERKHAQENLKKNEELFRGIYEISPLAIALFDQTGRQFHFNQAQWEIFGIADLESVKDYNLFNEVFMTQARKEHLSQGLTLRFETAYDFTEIKRRSLYLTVKSGTIFLDVVITPLKSNPQGPIVGYLSQAQDVTQRKHALESLRISEERYALAQEAARIGTWDWDIVKGALHCSDTIESLLGFRQGEFKRTYQAFLDCVHPDDKGIVIPAFRRCIEDRKSFSIEHRIVWPSGTVRWVAESGNVMIDPTGKAMRMLGIVQDITERKLVEETSMKLSMAVEQNPALVIITDIKGQIDYVNPKFTRVTGYTFDEVSGKSLRILSSEETPFAQYQDLWKNMSLGEHWSGEICNKKKNADIFWTYTTVSPIKSKDGAVSHYVVIMEDVTIRKEYEKKIEYQANYDALTGLPNRILAFDRLRQAISRAQRNHLTVAVMYLDLDQFKLINDTFGHVCGDQLLIEVASRLRLTLRGSDTIARISSDEFLVVLPDLEEGSYADIVASKMLDAFSKPVMIGNHEIFVTTGVGISLFPGDGDDAETLIRNADSATIKAKSEQRNGVRYFTVELNKMSGERMEFATQLRYAVERKEFILHYQPLFDTQSGKVFGVEALVRWQNPALGLLPPDRFIPIAEETGVIVPIGRWVLYEACRNVKMWRDTLGMRLKASVNVSSYQLREPRFLEMVQQCLLETGLFAGDLELEVTEHLLMEDVPLIKELLDSLHALGVSLAIDDFGTGYSALSYLKKFPFNTLKIDRFFIGDVLKTSETKELTKAIISMAHSLKLRVIAEGIETQEQLEYLKSQGCDYAQGFHLSRPLPAEKVIPFLNTCR